MPDERLPHRTLASAFWLAVLLTLLFATYGHGRIAAGLAVGSAIGLSSLWSLVYVVPRLMRPKRPAARLLMSVAALGKLTIYAVVLNFAMTSRYILPVAVFAGATLVPAVITLKVLGNLLTERAEPSAGDASCRS